MAYVVGSTNIYNFYTLRPCRHDLTCSIVLTAGKRPASGRFQVYFNIHCSPISVPQHSRKSATADIKMSALEKSLHASRQRSTVIWHRIVRSLVYLLAFVFLLLVMIGNISNKPVLRESYFFKLDTANVVPQSVPNAIFINTIARSIGLHDFYQVGLWNYCEGYYDTGITYCSTPKAMFWFDPVKILLNELLAGATSMS